MIIKIQSAGPDGGWCFYDNAEAVFHIPKENIQSHFAESVPKDVEKNQIAEVEDNLFQGSFFHGELKGLDDSGWQLTFQQRDKSYELYGDTECYLLNDNGKTIERIY